jgi:cysteine synthase
MNYKDLLKRKNEIMKKALKINYDEFEEEGISFNYDMMMGKASYNIEEIRKIQNETKVGNTPLFELKNITKVARTLSAPGKGARIFIKDEATNPSGSFKDRRASIAVYYAKKKGYKGVIAATSGNYGAAVASQANMRGLKSIIAQEVFDSRGYGQPEILEKGRKCEAYGAEVMQLSVGPELFGVLLWVLDDTGFFNASLYTPFAIAGIETLGYEIATELKKREGKNPDAVIITNAGGGNLTGTARGLIKAGSKDTKVIASSVNLSGLHMASDYDFNRKSFTTGHTGFGIPFTTWPDRTDVPRNAARVLRYMDRYVTVTQGEVFYMTEALAQLEGMERGPAGNVSLSAAFSIAQEMEKDEIIIVQETEYTGAGKHPIAQINFARENGIKVKIGNPEDEIPGKNIIIPESPEMIRAKNLDINKLRESYIRNTVKRNELKNVSKIEVKFLIEETKTNINFVISTLEDLGVKVKETT